MSFSGATSDPHVAVIGAGMAGLACAAQLKAAGIPTRVFDKGHRPGGRMSTRSVDTDLSFDHGCQYFSANDPHFERHVKSWINAGIASEWHGTIIELENGKVTHKPQTRVRYRGLPEMNSVCSHLATGLNVHSGVNVCEARRNDGKWHLLDVTGASLGQFVGLILATPPQQAEKLITHSPSLLAASRCVNMSACWTVMLAFTEPIECSFDGAVIRDSPLSWIARNSSKADTTDATECWVGQANAEWSGERVDAVKDVIAAQLSDEFCRLLNFSVMPAYIAGHRWKYAIPETPLDTGCLFDDALKVGLCGDWCLGNRVEAAWLSGTAAANRLLAAK